MSEQIPDELIALIKKSEGCKLKAYLCPRGIPTIGYGSTGEDVSLGMTWTQEMADDRLRRDIEKFVRATRELCPTLETAQQVAAIADFAYNTGINALSKSTLRKRILEKKWWSVEHELNRWVHCNGKVLNGLVTRRKAEVELFFS